MTSESEPVVTSLRRTRKIPAVDDEVWNHVNALRKEYQLTWNELFQRFAVYENGIRYIFEAPQEVTKPTRLDLNTTMALIDLWVENMRLNLHTVEDSPTILDLRENGNLLGKAGIAVGAGPTLKTYKHLETLKEYNFDGPIIVAGHELKECLEAGVVPTHAILVDANRDLMMAFIDHDIVREHMKEIKMVFCVSVHPDVVKAWTGPKYFFYSGIPQSIIPNVDTLLSKMLPNTPYMDTTGNAGGAAYSLAAFIGCKTIATIGIDFAYPKDQDPRTTMYWEAYAQSIGAEEGYKDEADLIQKVYHPFHHPVFGTDCYTDFVYEVFFDAFQQLAKVFNKLYGVTTINATEGGRLHSAHIRSMKFRKFLDRYGSKKTITTSRPLR